LNDLIDRVESDRNKALKVIQGGDVTGRLGASISDTLGITIYGVALEFAESKEELEDDFAKQNFGASGVVVETKTLDNQDLEDDDDDGDDGEEGNTEAKTDSKHEKHSKSSSSSKHGAQKKRPRSQKQSAKSKSKGQKKGKGKKKK
jgi:hypothetical protein